MKTTTTHPQPGETYFQSRPRRDLASTIAHEHYDVESLTPVSDEHSGQFWAIRTHGGYAALLGFLDIDHGNCLAILHKNPDGSRTLEAFPDILPTA